MRNPTLRSLALVGGLFVLAASVSTHALPLENRRMYLGFSRAVALPGVELPAGTYIFELPATDSSLVRVTNREHTKVYLTAFTIRIDRPRTLKPGQVVTLGEAPRGVAPPITA